MKQASNNQLTLLQRVKAPTPKFFKTLRTVGLSLAAVGAALLTAPVALPAIVITIAGYLTLAGTVVTAVSQTTVEVQNNLPATRSSQEVEEANK
jgi:ABC-type xylose transport system permease subunit